MKSATQILTKKAKERQREERKKAGFFDGRFRNRIITDKKKQEKRKACKKQFVSTE